MKTKLLFSLIVLVALAVTNGRAQELTGFSEKGKWGFKNAQGTVVVKPVYDTVYSFSDGMARVMKKDKYGYIDRTGKVVIKIQYTAATDFEDGVAAVSKEMLNMDHKAHMRAAGAAIAGSASQIATSAAGMQASAEAMAHQAEMGLYVDRATGGNLKAGQQLQRFEQQNAAIRQQSSVNFQQTMAAGAAGRMAANSILSQGSMMTPGLCIVDKTGKKLISFSLKTACVSFVKMDAMPGNLYLMANWAGIADWGGPLLLKYGIFDADTKKIVIPAEHTRFDMETFADRKWIIAALFKTTMANPIRHYYGIMDYSGKAIIPTEHEIFDVAVFAPHERILVGDFLKRDYNTFNLYAGCTVKEVSYGVIDYSGCVIVPKMKCEGIELADNLFVATDANGSKRYFDLNGKETKQ